jgi:hypothetical protein
MKHLQELVSFGLLLALILSACAPLQESPRSQRRLRPQKTGGPEAEYFQFTGKEAYITTRSNRGGCARRRPAITALRSRCISTWQTLTETFFYSPTAFTHP